MSRSEKSKKYLRVLIPIVIGLIILVIPTPPGLSVNAWRFFALFVAVIAGLILEPLPSAAVGLIGVIIATVFMLVEPTPKGSIKWALSGFSNTVIWLVFAGYMFATAFRKTGLGRRIALYLIKTIGRKTLGLGYAVALIDTILGPFIPSNTARNGGIIYPILANIPPIYGSEPRKESARKIGSYLMWTAYAADSGVSSLFLTGLAPNLLLVALAAEITNISITWTEWFVSGLPIALPVILLVPYLTYKLYPPLIKESPKIVEYAEEELKKMGKMSRQEKILAMLMFFALALWITGKKFIHSTAVAILILCLMLIFKILDWNDVLSNRSGWNVLIWFGTLVTLAGGLSKVGIVEWIAEGVGDISGNLSPVIALLVIAGVFYWTHYGFASVTAHTTALFPAFLTIALAVPGVQPKVAILLLGHALGLFGVISPYATGPSPIYYGSGYIKTADFWKLGFIYGLINFVLLIVIGLPWIMSLY